MANRFDHSRLPAWNALTSEERYWAGYLARYADDRGLVSEWHYGTSTFLERTDGLELEARYKAYLCESLLTALTHREPTIAFRALLQAAGYKARVDWPWLGSSFQDAFRVAQARVEELTLNQGRVAA